MKDTILEIINNIVLIKDDSDKEELIAKLSDINSPTIVSFVNAHALNICYKNKAFSSALLSSDIILRDGIGLQIMYKSFGIDGGLNMNGTDFIPSFLDSLGDRSIAVFATQEPYLGNAVAKLKTSGKNIIVEKNGFCDDDTYLDMVIKYKPEIIVLGMGMPKQELLADYLKTKVNYPCILINGGAIIDFLGGKVDRAPIWMRNYGIEWLYRLVREPRRLFKRYVIGNILFMYRIADLKRVFT